MNRPALVLALSVLCCALPGQWRADGAEGPPNCRVGLARACITPKESLWLAGYGGRRQPSQGVLDDLLAQALAIEDADGRRALLLTVDLCALRTPTVNQVCRQIAERTGLKREQILVSVSHTHSGPAVDLMDGGFYPIPPDDRRKLEAYTEKVKSHLVDLAVAALGDLKPAELTFGVGTATFFENRRALDADGRYRGMGPNPQNHADRDVPVLRVTTPEGKVRALVFGAACHNVTLGGGSYKISADYAGAARKHVETRLPGVQAMFVTGCGADANPNPRSTADEEEWVKRHGESLGTEVLNVISRPMRPVTGPLATQFAFVDLSLQEVSSREELEQKRQGSMAYQAGLMLAALDRGQKLPTKFAAPISVWQLGNSLTLVGLPEETVSEYVPLLKRVLGAEGLWTAGYCNDVSGYLPTVKILGEGGYECRGLFGPDIGWFAPEAEKEVVRAVCRLARQAGRKLPPPRPTTDVAPVGWWRFEPDGLLEDASGHGHPLAAHHGPATGGEPAPASGSKASAAFNGASYLEGGKMDLPNAKKAGLTLAAWIKPDKDALSGARMIVCKWANAAENDHFALYLSDGKPGIAVADGLRGERGLHGKTVLEAERWYFVAGTWDAVSRQYRLFVNGRPDPSVGYQAGGGINAASEATLKIGAEAVPGFERHFRGLIDEVMLLDVALDEEAVGRLHRGNPQRLLRPEQKRSR